jgi:hypothetical protein
MIQRYRRRVPDAAVVLAMVAALAGVIVLASTLVPGEWLAGAAAAGAGAMTPAVLDATGAGAGGVVAAGFVWTAVLAVRARRAPSPLRVVLAAAGAAATAAAVALDWHGAGAMPAVGNGAPLLLAGLVGLGLGAVTGLRGAAIVLALVAAAIAASAGAAAVLLIGAGLGPLAGAAVRLLTSNPTPGGRLAISAAVSAPVLLLGALLGASP